MTCRRESITRHRLNPGVRFAACGLKAPATDESFSLRCNRFTNGSYTHTPPSMSARSGISGISGEKIAPATTEVIESDPRHHRNTGRETGKHNSSSRGYLVLRVSMGLWCCCFAQCMEQLDCWRVDLHLRRNPDQSTAACRRKLGQRHPGHLGIRLTLDLWIHRQHGQVHQQLVRRRHRLRRCHNQRECDATRDDARPATRLTCSFVPGGTARHPRP
jgi:hypothetical protein